MSSLNSKIDGSSIPDVTVIVICYNDAEHLAAAVRSVLSQTLSNLEVIISDDHSTDDTPEVARNLCAEDSRVRYHRLAQNSGGCGAPRNEAIDLARGNYVMFLDSDDLLERHACKNLLLEAERTGAELVSGKMIRVYLGDNRRTEPWYGWLYESQKSVESINEWPEFIHDTAVTNKLYLRAFLLRTGIRFPVDIHYEDMIFSAEALTQARGISVIPETIYYWNVYPRDERTSISNQREEEKNLRDRLYATDIAKQTYRASDKAVQDEVDRKFLNHHVRLYLNDLYLHDDQAAKNILGLIKPYVEKLPTSAFEVITLPERLLYASVLELDVSAVRNQIQALGSNAVFGNIFSTSSERYWSPTDKDSRPNSNELAKQLSDLKTEHLASQPHSQLAYSHLVTSIRTTPTSIGLRGTSTDPLGKLRSDCEEFRVHLGNNSGGGSTSTPAVIESTANGISWSVTIPAPKRHSLRENEGRFFSVTTTLKGGASNTSPLRFAETVTSAPLPDRSILGRLLGDSWILRSPRPTERVAEIASANRGNRFRILARKTLRFVPGRRRILQMLRPNYTEPRALVLDFVYPILRRLPLKKNLIVFEANIGRSAYDNPRGVYESITERHPEMKALWVHDGSRNVINALPPTKKVKRGSYGYLSGLARAKYLVDNQSFPHYFEKRTGQRYLQTWHGIPLKTLGYDELGSHSTREASRIARVASFWDGLVVPSPYFERVFVPAYGYKGECIRYGSPRNDQLMELARDKEPILKRLDLSRDRKIVLYAPTFREAARGNRSAELLIDLEAWNEAFGNDVTLLIRSHYLNRIHIPEKFQGLCVDVSDYPNVSELYAVADLLITDYSSVMFDYALLDRPIVIFAPDYLHYTERSRGTYFDLRATPPGHFTEDVPTLLDAVKQELETPSSLTMLSEFRMLYCGDEDGNASARAAEFLLKDQ